VVVTETMMMMMMTMMMMMVDRDGDDDDDDDDSGGGGGDDILSSSTFLPSQQFSWFSDEYGFHWPSTSYSLFQQKISDNMACIKSPSSSQHSRVIPHVFNTKVEGKYVYHLLLKCAFIYKLPTVQVCKITDLWMVMYSKSGKSRCLKTSCNMWEMTPVADIVTGKVYTSSYHYTTTVLLQSYFCSFLQQDGIPCHVNSDSLTHPRLYNLLKTLSKWRAVCIFTLLPVCREDM